MDQNKDYQVLNEEIEFKLKELADLLGASLPPGWGFTLFLNSFGPNSQLFYMSNSRREDILATLKEFIRLQEQKPLPPQVQ